MSNKIRKNQGFTLIEVLVVVSVTLTIAYIGMDYLRSAFKLARFSSEQQDAVSIARDSMAHIIKNIRGANASEQGNYPLYLVDDEELIFFSDVDDDNIFEQVRYFVDANNLLSVITKPGPLNNYQIAGATTTIATYLNNDEEAVFTFFNEDYSETDTINEIRLIKITLKINITPEIAPNDVYVESDVNLRNLKDNL